MAFTKYQAFLAILLVFTGSLNTITTKWADRLTAKGSDGVERPFDHPFLQACTMFLGEMLCLLVFKCVYYYYWRKQDGSQDVQTLTKGNRNFNPLILLPPALCDMCATSVMYIGLTLTYAASFQMFRGAVIVFVGIFSRIFLGRRLKVREWIGIFFVIAGLVVVGLSDMSTDHKQDSLSYSTINGTVPTTKAPPVAKNTSDIIVGDLMIIGAQIIVATQMVWEEKFVSGLDIPAMQAVGWEGVYGFVMLGLLLIPFYYIPVPPPFSDNSRSTLEDVPEAFVQMANQNLIICALIGTIISIAFFNYAGISVTKEISATTRMVLDSVRTFVIWMFSLALRWQDFHYLQVIGFILLIFGMCLYNDVLVMQAIRKVIHCCKNCRNSSDEPSRENLLSSQPADQLGGEEDLQR
ncbi:solute carrier family 35 member F6 [Anabrus simplex]|uniref:solute carrier family 35 member F6 n=1 Tax=Anabrus simplex TaxID=316456 RepID=UPI0035A35205